MSLAVIILAAGRGVRMRGTLPKLLHSVGGVSLLRRLLSTVNQINPQQIVIVTGHESDQLKKAFENDDKFDWVLQEPQLGTGHAVLQALPTIKKNKNIQKVLILYGDTPLITVETLHHLLQNVQEKEIGLISLTTPTPAGYGRIVRNKQGKVLRIVEEKDASLEEKSIQEVNKGFFVAPKSCLEQWLPKIKNDNPQKEYYLPDIIPFAVEEGFSIKTLSPTFDWEVRGINDKIQLAELERIFQREQAHRFMREGMTLLDPARFDVRGELKFGKEVTIDVNVLLEGRVILGNNVIIGPNVYMKDTIVQDNVQILANSFIDNAKINSGCRIGPFARIRPGTELAEDVHIGNFVEVKNSTVGTETKINHLSYVGDASVGQKVNIGAGTITCNYDGQKKHRTIIKDRVFIGSDTQLIAPVTVGEGVTIGAGTTVTKDVPSNQLIHNKIDHCVVENWSLDKELE